MTHPLHAQARRRGGRLADRSASLILVGLLVPIAGGRWGSYLAVPGTPLFVADLFICLGIVGLFASQTDSRRRIAPIPRSLGWGSAVILLVLVASLLTNSSDEPSLVLRDAAPLVYLAITPIVFKAIALNGRERVLKWLRIACSIHVVWFAAAMFGALPPIPLGPFSAVPAFTTRGDYDLLISALAAVVLMIDRSTKSMPRIALCILAVASLLMGGSRAGLLSGLVLLLLALLLVPERTGRVAPLAVVSISFGTAAVLPVLVLVLDDPPPWMKALGRILDVGSQEQASASNTWNARVAAWERLVAYTAEDPQRLLIGSGLGSQPVLDSGAVQFLSGDPSVRAAHNFTVTWFAFFGVVGVVLLVSVLVLWAFTGLIHARSERGVPGLGVALVAGVVLAGLGGVIIESPFGYMTLILGIALSHQGPEPTSRSDARKRAADRVRRRQRGSVA